MNPPPGLLEDALNAANKAVRLAPNDGRAFMGQANALFYAGNLEPFVVSAERALLLNPYSADIIANMGSRFAYAGQWERGLALLDTAMAMQPYHPGTYYFAAYFDHYRKGEYEMALAKALKMNIPDYVWAQGALAAAYGQLGRVEEAKPVVARMLEMRPDIEKTARADRWKFFRYQEDLLDHFLEGLRKAGLDIPDEPATAD